MFKFKKIAFFTAVCLFVLLTYFWYANQTETEKTAKLLYETNRLESACSSSKPIEFPIEAFDSAVLDPECVKNKIKFAELKGIDLKKTSPEKNCKCLKQNLDKVVQTYGTAQDQCLLIQAKIFVEKRCLELSTR